MNTTVSLTVNGEEAVIELKPIGAVNRQILSLAIQGRRVHGVVGEDKEGTFRIRFSKDGEMQHTDSPGEKK